MGYISNARWYGARARRAFVTASRTRGDRSDYRRWADLDNFNEAWSPRTEALAAMVVPGQSVIEFGAGQRALEPLLPPGCNYTPSDLVSRGHGTLVIDLNVRPLPALPVKYDVAVFAGVLEYVTDAEMVLRWLRPSVSAVLLSYVDADSSLSLPGKARRRGAGWVNDFTRTELLDLLEEVGFTVTAIDEWQSGRGAELLVKAEST